MTSIATSVKMLSLLPALFVAQAAVAQNTTPSGNGVARLPIICKLAQRSLAHPSRDADKQLTADCESTKLSLGVAGTYTAVNNLAIGSTLVVKSRSGQLQVLLITPLAIGSGVHVDDLTRDFSQLSGRASETGLRATAVDTSRFATDATIGLKGLGRRLDLTSYAARAAAAQAPSVSSVK